MKTKIDIFNPLILVVGILIFLIMGYIGSFNYRFEDPLDLEVILTLILSCIIFSIGALFVKYKINFEKTKEFNFINEKILINYKYNFKKLNL